MALLTTIVALGVVIQGVSVLTHRVDPQAVPPAPFPYSWALWVTLPASRMMGSFGPWTAELFTGTRGVVATLFVVALAIPFAFRQPYRDQKLLMACLGLVIAFSAMLSTATR